MKNPMLGRMGNFLSAVNWLAIYLFPARRVPLLISEHTAPSSPPGPLRHCHDRQRQ